MPTPIARSFVLSLLIGCRAAPGDGVSAPVPPTVTATLPTGSAASTPDAQERSPGVWALDGLAPDLPTDDLDVLAGVLGDAEVVALGESVHFSDGYHQARARLIPWLVVEHGVRAIAFEGPWATAESARPFVERCEGSVDDAMSGLYFAAWQSTSTVRTLEWLCAWNAEHPNDPVTFFGFDVQEPWRDRQELADGLSAVDPTATAPLVDALGECVGAGYADYASFFGSDEGRAVLAGTLDVPPERTAACERALADVVAYIDANEARFTGEAAPLARVAVRAIGAAHGTFAAPIWDVAGWDARDAGMADVFEAMRALRAPGARTAIWAANGHIVADSESVTESAYPAGWVGMGSHLRDRLGDGYAPIGFFARSVTWSWPGLPVETAEAPRGSLERALDAVGEPVLVVDPAAAAADGTWIEAGAAYPAGTPAPATFVPAAHYRAILFLSESGPIEFAY